MPNFEARSNSGGSPYSDAWRSYSEQSKPKSEEQVESVSDVQDNLEDNASNNETVQEETTPADKSAIDNAIERLNNSSFDSSEGQNQGTEAHSQNAASPEAVKPEEKKQWTDEELFKMAGDSRDKVIEFEFNNSDDSITERLSRNGVEPDVIQSFLKRVHDEREPLKNLPTDKIWDMIASKGLSKDEILRMEDFDIDIKLRDVFSPRLSESAKNAFFDEVHAEQARLNIDTSAKEETASSTEQNANFSNNDSRNQGTEAQSQNAASHEGEKAEEKKQWTDEELFKMAGASRDSVIKYEINHSDNAITELFSQNGVEPDVIKGFLKRLHDEREPLKNLPTDKTWSELEKRGLSRDEILRMEDSDIYNQLLIIGFYPYLSESAKNAFLKDVHNERAKLIDSLANTSQEQDDVQNLSEYNLNGLIKDSGGNVAMRSNIVRYDGAYSDDEIRKQLSQNGIASDVIDGYLKRLHDEREPLKNLPTDKIWSELESRGFSRGEILRMEDSVIDNKMLSVRFYPHLSESAKNAFLNEVHAEQAKLSIDTSADTEQNQSLSSETITDPNSLTPEGLLQATLDNGGIDLDSFLKYDDKRMRETIKGQFANVKPENVDAVIASINAYKEKQNAANGAAPSTEAQNQNNKPEPAKPEQITSGPSGNPWEPGVLVGDSNNPDASKNQNPNKNTQNSGKPASDGGPQNITTLGSVKPEAKDDNKNSLALGSTKNTKEENGQGSGSDENNPSGIVDGEYHFSFPRNKDSETNIENPDTDKEKGQKFEKGDTRPYGDFGDWLEKNHNLKPEDLNKLDSDERKKILKEYQNLLNGENNGGENGGGDNPNGANGEGEAEKNSETGTGDDGGEKPEDKKEDAKNEEALAFVSLATEEEAKIAAREIADQMFAENVAHSKNPFKRIILGNMLKEGVLAHYRKKALEAIVAYNADKNDDNKKYKNETISQYWSKNGGIERFTLAYMEQVLPAIHSRAGENMQGYTTRTNEEGEIYVVTKDLDKEGNIVEKVVDPGKNPGAKAAIDIRKAIEGYAGGKFTLESLKEEVRRIQQGQGISDEKLDLSVDNLVELAEAAKNRAQHAEGIINVMEGFSYINGDAMRNVRTEARKTNIEKASEFISEHTMGLISPEIIGGAASLMLFFTDKGARTVARAIAPGVGGAIIAGAAAGIRERGRVSEDIATSSREAAMSRDVMGPNGREGKYDKQVAETLYNMQSAEVLTESLNKALEKNDTDAMQKTLASINQLINLSDSQKIDLIRYSSSENVEDERMNLDVARAKVQVALNKAGVDLAKSDTYREALITANNEIGKDISAKDKARCSLKRKRALGQGAKTAAVSILAGTAIREVSAYFNPNQVGILDHVFNKENNYNATNTPLASFLGLKEEGAFTPGESVMETVTKYEDAELTQSQVEDLGRQGYIIHPKTVIEGGTSTTQVSVAEYAQNHSNGGFVRNWLNNGTPESNGNELRGYYTSEHGWHTGMYGESFGGGVSRDFEDDMAAGKVHAFFSFSRGSQSTPIELSERVFTAADGSQQMEFFSENPEIQALLDQKLGMVEIASESGRFAADGTPIMDIWATWPGKDVEGTITDTIDNTVKKTVYDVFKNEVTHTAGTSTEGVDRLISGIPIFPFASRKALHKAMPADGKRKQAPTPEPKPDEPTPEPTPPAPTPEPRPTPTNETPESNPPRPALPLDNEQYPTMGLPLDDEQYPAGGLPLRGWNGASNSQEGNSNESQTGNQSQANNESQTQTDAQSTNNNELFRPVDGGEWTADNLRPLPTDSDTIVAMMSRSASGRRLLEIEGRRSQTIGTFTRWVENFNNSTTMTAEQKAAIMNGHDPVPELDTSDDIETVFTLRRVGILPQAV